ncbi:MAG: hypothetical protein LBR58_07920 [Propionibacteriaceae bacterium]|jgi:hypothetical protein|nr:hypothetical protein [Propionibacteriaceae bacterium]
MTNPNVYMDYPTMVLMARKLESVARKLAVLARASHHTDCGAVDTATQISYDCVEYLQDNAANLASLCGAFSAAVSTAMDAQKAYDREVAAHAESRIPRLDPEPRGRPA